MHTSPSSEGAVDLGNGTFFYDEEYDVFFFFIHKNFVSIYGEIYHINHQVPSPSPLQSPPTCPTPNCMSFVLEPTESS